MSPHQNNRAVGSRTAFGISLAVTILAATGCTNSLTNGYFAEMPSQRQASLDPPGANDPVGVPGGPGSPPPVLGPNQLTEKFALTSTATRQVERYKDVDLLWVIDNSGSMDAYQDRVVRGFKDFAQTYFMSNRNVRSGVVTTDVYVAGKTASSAKYGPGDGKCYSRLLPGIHDGPRPGIASLNDDCTLSGALPAGRTGRPILDTQNADGSPVDLAKLISDFQVNAKAGTSGSGSERAFQSLDRFLADNEERSECASGGPGCLFRKGKIRGVFFLGDEHSHDVLSYNGETIDHSENAIVRMNDLQVIDSAKKLAQATQSRLDGFFRNLEGSAAADPSYFVVSIANLTCASDCGYSGGSRSPDERWGPEYAALADLVKADVKNSVAQYSAKADINQADYTKIMDQVGRSLENEVERVIVSAFTLGRAPSGTTPPLVSVLLENGSRIPVAGDQVKLSGSSLEVNQSALPSPLPDNAQLEVSYLPAGS